MCVTAGGFFDGFIAQQLTRAKWISIPYPVVTHGNAAALVPDMRGGHQMCVDSDAGRLYLFGGWNGSRELGDFWQFTIANKEWKCLSLDSSQEVRINCSA